MHLLLFLFSLLGALPLFADAVVTNAAEATRIAFAGEPKHVAFDIRATVTSSLTEMYESFNILDASGAANIIARDCACPPIRLGDRVRVSGFIDPYPDGNAYARATNVTILAHGDAPEPIDVRAAEIYHGLFTYQRVRVKGLVVDAFRDEADPRFTFLVLTRGPDTLYLPSNALSDDDLKSLVNTTISAVGTCSSYRHVGPRAKLGYEVYIDHRDDITILKPAPHDPFDAPLLSGDFYGIFQANPEGVFPRRKLFGEVIAIGQKKHIILKTPTGDISTLSLATAELPKLGASIEAVGIPETDFYHFNLSRAIWRDTAPLNLTNDAPTSVRVQDVLTDGQGQSRFNVLYHGRTIRLKGLVRSVAFAETGRLLIHLLCDGFIVPVDASAIEDLNENLEIGAQIEVTGICLMMTENWRPQTPFPHIAEMSIVLRTPRDIRVLVRPPWWTPTRLISVIAALLTLLAAILVWNMALRRAALIKGRELMREQLGHIKAKLKTEERTRLAVELHDSLAQSITGVSMEMEAANELRGEAPKEMIAHLHIASKALKSCRDELRNCLWDLRSKALEEKDFSEAIRITLQPHVSASQVEIDFHVPRSKLSDETAHALLRIIRELVLNAIRHGHANVVRVAGALHEKTLVSSVADNGCGFDPASAPGITQGHFGLQGIRERMESLGGTFEITSDAKNGTRAILTLTL